MQKGQDSLQAATKSPSLTPSQALAMASALGFFPTVRGEGDRSPGCFGLLSLWGRLSAFKSIEIHRFSCLR